MAKEEPLSRTIINCAREGIYYDEIEYPNGVILRRTNKSDINSAALSIVDKNVTDLNELRDRARKTRQSS